MLYVNRFLFCLATHFQLHTLYSVEWRLIWDNHLQKILKEAVFAYFKAKGKG